MIAITLVLAAVVGAMVFTMSGSEEPAPTVALSETVEEQSVRYTVDSGETFDPDQASVLVDVTVEDSSSGATTTTSFDTSLTGSQTKTVSVGGSSYTVEYNPSISSSQVGSGDSFSVELDGSPSNIRLSEVDTRVVWEDGSSSTTLFSSSADGASNGGGSGPAAPSISATTQLVNNNPGVNSRVDLWITNIDGGSEIDPTDIQVEIEVEAENPNDGSTETVTQSTPQSGWYAADDPYNWDPEFTTLHSSGDPYLAYVPTSDSEWSAETTSDPAHVSVIIYEDGYDTTIADYRITLTHEPSGTTIYQESTF